MISILPTFNKQFRAFGWVQNPSNFRSLCDVVAIFNFNTAKHKALVSKIIPKLVLEKDGRDDLLNVLNSRPLKIKYSHLVGTSFRPRSSARCNGIVQATVKGQGKKQFIDDWSADGFVRWAHCFDFIKYDYENDAFEITKTGLELSQASMIGDEINTQEKKLLINAILAYPPAIRILSLLAENNAHLTKFEIGKQLGFVGDAGFTSQPQSLLIRALSAEINTKDKNKMRTDWEGSSDKYARMIATWLVKLGLVEKAAKDVTVSVGGNSYTETIGQSFMITAQGLTAYRRALGKSKHSRISKNVCFEMLATKGADREYLRTKRALIIKFLSESKKSVSVVEVRAFLAVHKIIESNETIIDDIQGLVNIGLNIETLSATCIKWNDLINDFAIPLPQKPAKSSLKELLLKLLHY